MKVRLINNIFLDGETRFAGEEVEITDKELLKGYLERGAVVDAAEPLPEAKPFGVEGDLKEEVRTPDGDVYKRFESASGGTIHTVNDREVVSENAYETAKQDVVRHNIENDRAANAAAALAPEPTTEAPTETPPLEPTPTPPVAVKQPTQADIDKDLASLSGDSGQQPSTGA